MTKFRKLLVAAILAASVAAPLTAIAVTSPAPQHPVVRIADEPTATPTHSHGNEGTCHNGGC
ncbi:MAG TPA: hypothetical protein VFD70_15760 [Anaerolineae bacterium]|nr:hypothetical protein [Anaerolineae bacterium]